LVIALVTGSSMASLTEWLRQALDERHANN